VLGDEAYDGAVGLSDWNSATIDARSRSEAETKSPTERPAEPSDMTPVSTGPTICPTAKATVKVAIASDQWCFGSECRATEVTDVTTAKNEPPNNMADRYATNGYLETTGRAAPTVTTSSIRVVLCARRSRAMGADQITTLSIEDIPKTTQKTVTSVVWAPRSFMYATMKVI
jgi:hypothetical protein